MQRRFRDLYVALAWSLIGILAATFSDLWIPLRIMFALPLVVFLPGYLLIRALDIRQGQDTLDLLMFSIGSSVALAILAGLILNWTPWGLFGPGFPLTLGFIAIICGVLALKRRNELRHMPEFRLNWQAISALLLVCIIFIGAVTISHVGADAQPQSRFTQLWLVPETQNSQMVNLGVTNHESSLQTYSLVLLDHGRQVADWNTISLSDNMTWQQTLPVSSNALLRADLYESDHPGIIYRHVSLTITP